MYIAELYCVLRQIPFAKGFLPEGCKKVTDFEKDTLGIFITIDNNTKDQQQYILSKTRHIVKFLKTFNLEK